MGLLLAFATHARLPVLGAQVPGEIRGRITDAQSGLGVGGARIEVVGHATAAIADVGGAFVLRGLEPGTFAVRVRAVGHVPRDTVAVLANGRSSDLDVALQPVVSRLERVVVQATRDSASAMTFDRTAIQQSGRRDLGELLQSVPGVVVTRDGGPGSPSRISIRGSAASEVLVLVNGIPINSAFGGDADLSSIGLERAERVTVLTGAQSARYGGRALAGAVVIETRRAEQELSGAASAGAWGERNASLTFGRTRERERVRTAALVTADYRDVRGDFSYEVPAVRGGGTARRFNADARSTGVLATASIDRADGEPGSLQIRGEWQRRSRGLPGSIVQPSATGRQHDSRLTGGIDGRWQFSRVTLTANGDATREHAVFADPAPPFGTTYDDAIDANSLMAASTMFAGSASRSITVGGETRALDVTSTSLAPGAPRRQHQTGAWSTVRASRSANAVDLAADLSIRADWDSFVDGAVVSPRGVLSVARGYALVAATFGAGYSPPSLADQFFHEGVFVRANPGLRPERVRHEIEVRATLRDVNVAGVDVGGELVAYRADIDDLILWQPNFQFIWSPSNFDVRRNGWELSGRLAARSIGADLRGSVARSDVSYVGPVLSGQVAYRPRSTANVTAGLSRWDTRLEIATRYIGARRTVPASRLNVLDAYSLTDVALSRPFVRGPWRVDLRVAAENVFDRAASMLVDYPFPGRAWTIALRTRRQ